MSVNETFPSVTPKPPDFMPKRPFDLLAILAVAATATGLVGGRVIVSSEAQKNKAREARQEALASNAAQEQADHYINVLNDSIGKSVPIGMKVLYGTVAINDGELPHNTAKNSNFHPAFKDPILLTTRSKAHYDAKGHFLKGGYIGLQTTESNGQIVITPVPYDSQTMIFTPDDLQQPVLDVAVYATSTNNRSQNQTYQLVAFDATGDKLLKHPDDSPIAPGTIIPQP